MKKFIALLAILALCVAVAIHAVATDSFLGSPDNDSGSSHDKSEIIVGDSFQDNDIDEILKDMDLTSMDELLALLNSETFMSIDDCIVVTNVLQAEEKQTDISQETRDLLIDVYNQLVDGTMTLPIEESFSVRDLVDVSFAYEACELQEDHGNKAKILALPGITLSIDFDLGVDADEELVAMTYVDVDGEMQWVEIESVTNNGDGTVTCVFEDICPVAFAVMD
jgi:hypothetical protein